MKLCNAALLLGEILSLAPLTAQSTADRARWHAEAARTSILRDSWGIAHVHGHTDAEAVFAAIYAQCEDDFPRIEANYLTSLGRAAEAEGEPALWADLRQRLFIDPVQLRQEYRESPPWLRALMDAWADGINFYLARHPEVHPSVLTRFEPWMTLSFTEGSIGGDIERVDLRALQQFYADPAKARTATQTDPGLADSRLKADQSESEPEPGGSNGIAIAPAKTRNGHALLLINPHTSFFFRSELQMTSDHGLDAYGASTWGQFFIYQGFNRRAGWMHTSSGVDAVDEYTEHDHFPNQTYSYGNMDRPFLKRSIELKYKTPTGLATRTFTTYTTVHGPVIRTDKDGNWVSIQLMQRHVAALEQSFLRTKAHTHAEYERTMNLMANSSNNTVYADADGTIAYWQGDFIPRRNPKFDYTQPVDGADPETDWHGNLSLAEVPQLKNPASGFLFNVNDSPWNGAGISSLKQSAYPAYVEQGLESARGTHAMLLLELPNHTAKPGWTPRLLHDAAFDSYLPWFARTLPTLLNAYDHLPTGDAGRTEPKSAIDLLRAWDLRWSAESTATTLAVYWGTELLRTAGPAARAAHMPSEDFIATRVEPATLLSALASASARLTGDFGSTSVPWGQVNRFQRLTGAIQQPFSDTQPSIPVPFTSSLWGSLASFGARQYPRTKRWYGTSGNSFVAIVEFGPRVHAVAVTAGGESGHPSSPHFNDEAQRYVQGNLREVFFYPDQQRAHTERLYHPGQRTTEK